MLAYGLTFLREVGMNRIGLVSGYCQDVLEAMASSLDPSCEFVVNDQLGSQNAVSLLCALERWEEDLLVCDADYLRTHALANVLRLAVCEEATLFVKRVSGVAEDQMRVEMDATDTVVALSKTLPVSQAVSAGMMFLPATKREHVIHLTRETISRMGETVARVEDVLLAIVASGSVVRALDVGDAEWIEIDTPEELTGAEIVIRERGEMFAGAPHI